MITNKSKKEDKLALFCYNAFLVSGLIFAILYPIGLYFAITGK